MKDKDLADVLIEENYAITMSEKKRRDTAAKKEAGKEAGKSTGKEAGKETGNSTGTETA